MWNSLAGSWCDWKTVWTADESEDVLALPEKTDDMYDISVKSKKGAAASGFVRWPAAPFTYKFV